MSRQRKKRGSTSRRFWDHRDIPKLDLNFAIQSKRPISNDVKLDAEALLALAGSFVVENESGIRMRPTLELRNEIVATVKAFLHQERAI